MPQIKYTFRHPEGHELTEENYFKPDNVEKQVKWAIGVKDIELLSMEVTNPFVHEHTWKKRSENKFAMKSWYECNRCGMTAYKRLTSTGEMGGLTRSSQYLADKYERCRDQLKKLPIKLYTKEIHYAK